MTFKTLFAMLAAGVVGLGCSGGEPAGPPDGGEQRIECTSRAECTLGQVCATGNFCADCESSGQCRLREQCRADADAGTQRCALREGWGEACARNEECLAGAWCVQGLCQDSALVRLCPGGSDEECLQTQRCNPQNLVCEEDLGCAESADCGAAEVCNTGSHACVPRCTVDTQAEVCAAGEKCDGQKCVQCERDADCSPGLVCDDAGRCSSEDRCYQDRDCKVPLVCYLATGTCVAKPPPCVSDENCAPDERCNVGTGRCLARDCQPDLHEPNNDRDAAKTVAANARLYDLTLCESDIDYYAITLARGDRIGVNVDADPFAEHTFTTVVQDFSGRTLASGRLLAAYTASAPDTYFVGVASTDPYQPYDVAFLVTAGTPCDDDGHEPNDTASQAFLLNQSGLVDGTVCPQDQDHFALTVPPGRGFGASLVNYASGGGLLRLCVFEGQTVLGCSEDPGTPALSLTAAEAGGKSYVVRVSAVDPRNSNTYSLKVEFP